MRIAVWFSVLAVLFIGVGMTLRFCGSTAEVVHKEYNAGALLKKYEYFKDLAAAIDKKKADIRVYEVQLAEAKVYLEKRGSKEDRFYYEQLRSEATGIVMMYNQLAADYNAQMAKFNWRFTNSGDLPASNVEPLPRGYAPYILSLK